MKPKVSSDKLVHRGWWCQVCLQCVAEKIYHYCNCKYNVEPDKYIRIVDDWLPVFSEPLKKKK